MSDYNKDVLIIGAGPVGLFAVFECGMLGLNCVVLDTLPEIGGQCAALYPEKPIYDIPAYPKINGEDLISNLEKQIDVFSPSFCLGEEAQSFTASEDGFTVRTDKGNVIQAKAIIIAAGVGSFGPNRPPLENIESYEGKSVFYMVKRRADFAGKRIAIAGGGDSAVDWCLSLSEVAEKIYFIHRRDKFRAAEHSVNGVHALAETGKVEITVPYQLSALHGDNGQLEKLDIKDNDGNIRSLEVDILLPFFGLASSLKPFEDWGLNIVQNQIPVDVITQQTVQAGIYAIGDGCTYEGKLKLILQGFSEAATAAHSAHHFIYPDKALHFEHSTTKFASDKDKN